ncbi:MAG: hypothetical protein G8237_11375 [Magnetococcales bacterium]|nr:hypothetical protein [Magnetococcales bacterium]
MHSEPHLHSGPALRRIWISAALLAATCTTAPAPAQAEPTITAVAAVSTAVVAGAILLGSAVSGSQSYAPTGAVIYSSVTPVVQVSPTAPQPVVMATIPAAYYAIPTPGIQVTPLSK